MTYKELELVLCFAGVALALLMGFLSIHALQTDRRLSALQERRLKGLKRFRMGVYAVLAIVQAVPTVWLISLHGMTHASVADAMEVSALLAWLVSMVSMADVFPPDFGQGRHARGMHDGRMMGA